MTILLLGVGMQGKAALYDLVQHKEVADVIAADRDVESLQAHVARKQCGAKVECAYVDAANKASIDRLMKRKPDVVIDLLPVPYIRDVASAAVRHGIHLVNTFYPLSEVKALANEAEANGVTILPEFGMDPGLDLVLLGKAVRSLDHVESIITYGAGFPEPDAADNPLKYKITWTFEGVLRSYLRAGRVIRDGRGVDIPADAIFNPEHIHEIDIEGLGRLEAFPNGDATQYAGILELNPENLRDMGRYVLRWPGHCAFWKTIVDLHLLDPEPVVVDGVEVDRRRFLAAALEPHLRYGDDERDVVVVRIEVSGIKNGERQRVVYQVIDRRDLDTGFTAMNRTVGFTAVIGAVMIGVRQITKRGVLSPVNDVPYATLVRELQARGIQVTSTSTTLA